MSKLNPFLSLVTCLLMMTAVALRHSGKLCGITPGRPASADPPVDSTDFIAIQEDGTVVIDTTTPGAQIHGYAGPTPLKIYLKDGRVQLIEALPNQDTPEFFSATAENGFREQWYGKSAHEALAFEAKPATGATYSSTAFIQNVQAGLAAYLATQGEDESLPSNHSTWRPGLKFFCGLLVALAAAILPFFVKHRYYRMVQLTLNVLVLGFWCGTFVSYTLMVKFLSQGIHDLGALTPLVFLAMAFLFPLFGRRGHYCLHACPFGSLQELAGKCPAKKLRISPQWLKRLETFRQLLWALLMFVMWCGVGFAWMDNEPFAAFLFRTAPPVALTLALGFTVLSMFVPRPYCRFVCPTGSLIKFAEK
jgi:uncharacterized protein with FMN-binding domain